MDHQSLRVYCHSNGRYRTVIPPVVCCRLCIIQLHRYDVGVGDDVKDAACFAVQRQSSDCDHAAKAEEKPARRGNDNRQGRHTWPHSYHQLARERDIIPVCMRCAAGKWQKELQRYDNRCDKKRNDNGNNAPAPAILELLSNAGQEHAP